MKNKEKFKNISLSTLLGISYTLFILTFAIAIPIFCRSFFYMHIGWLDLVSEANKSGVNYTYLDIKEAYDAILDSCVFFFPFSEGKFPYSTDGMNHFLDCRGLFLLNNIVLIVSFIIFSTLMILKHKKVFINQSFKGFTSLSLAPLILLCFFLILGIWGIINFDSLFTAFHKLFFPGKDNWIFYYSEDPVIYIFNEQFFIDCAILIVVVYLILTSIPLISEIKNKRKRKKILMNLLDNK